MVLNLDKIDVDLIRKQSHLDCKCPHCGADYKHLKAISSDRLACLSCGRTTYYIHKPRKIKRQFTVAEDLSTLLDLEDNASLVVDKALRQYYKISQKKC